MSKDEITVKAQPQGFHFDDKTIKELERTIRKINMAAVIIHMHGRQPFTQVPEGSKCLVCGYVNQTDTDACVMCDTAGQIVLTIKRGESKDA